MHYSPPCLRVLCLFLFFQLVVISAGFEISYSQNTDPKSESESEDTFGYLRVNVVDLDSAYVVINEDFKSFFEIASGDTLTLPTGQTKIRIIKRYFVDQVTTFEIEEGITNRLSANLIPTRGREASSLRSSYPRLFWGANNFVLSDPETELFVNGEYVGTHFARIDTVGRFDVKGIHSSGATFSRTFEAPEDQLFHFHQKHLQPSRTTSRALSILPGGSQFYKGQNIKAVSFITGILGGAALAYSYDNRYQQSYDEFNMLADLYILAGNPSDAYRLGLEAQNALDDAERYSTTRDWIIYGTALLYVINVVDGFLAPTIGFRDKSRLINPYMDFDPVYQQPVIGFQTSF